MTDLGKSRAILSVDVSPDGLTVAGGTDLQGEDATILYWYVFTLLFYLLASYTL